MKNYLKQILSVRPGVMDWLPGYQRKFLPGDVIAGGIVAIMLVPQSMAYALLAGLPPQVGLYASILPVILYGLFGSSRALAVGPVAIVSLMVASSLGDLAEYGSEHFMALALALALISGLMLLIMGVLRLGSLINFLSHPVISGFTSAAALIIAFSQLKHLLGVNIPRSHLISDTLGTAWARMDQVNAYTLFIALVSIAILLYSKGPMARQLLNLGLPQAIVAPVSRTGPLFAVIFGTVMVWQGNLGIAQGVKTVGHIPAGLPGVSFPSLDVAIWWELLPAAALISFVGFLESVSVAKSLARKRRQKIDPDQELIGLGAANIGAAFTGGYPVTGGFSRSVVNFTAGANTPLASLITAGLVALTVIALTPLFYHLPKAVLAAIIMVAVFTLVDIKSFLQAWRYSRGDAASQLATFIAVLVLGVEVGIVFGIILSLLVYLWRTSRPHVAIVGRVPGTEHYRNIDRHKVETQSNILAMRPDENLYFANAVYLEEYILSEVSEHPEIDQVLLICNAISFIDTSALESLESLIIDLREVGVQVHLAEIKGPVMDRLQRSNLLDDLTPGQIFLSTHEAFEALRSFNKSDERSGPEYTI
ncbi:MAG: solute carrier family 26 protein [Alphaproteobacteria bacterium]|nr:solute carrier family 26 protein [Alphaproteobacteria bacterium]MBT5158659.1 solute carrier family 26 protein [Alphaproteobacteria bacterium]MBT5920034.1 solute carrier family 26 protein [Alphaproteobacteria bacterium]MBT6388111.1 solute carrier family 26 protein [Alphaproteobacteria bacterium]